ncbi:MAG: type III-B CRISPR module RAMP protein Cmr1 [Planctomycetota bacterium]|nr:MAG: type III-B CRISPR module RAMP protein Cmr1 [Planctomycetota bacterium]
MIPDFLLDEKMTPACPTPVDPITCDVEVVTPMFLAGADQQNIDCEYARSASVKAQLRWWWRAIAPYSTHEDLLEAEGRLFGDTNNGQGITVRTSDIKWSISTPDAKGVMGYLLGQGLFNHKVGVMRPAVNPGSQFYIKIIDKASSAELSTAITAFKMFGGLGARQRRGLGSISEINDKITGLKEYRAQIAALLNSTPSTPKTWSHITPQTRCIIIKNEFPSARDALTALGEPLLQFRQSLGGMEAPYGEDHDLISDHLHKRVTLNRSPQRAAFGIPHNYFFKSSKSKLDIHWDDNDRRASPLILHVAKLANGKYAALALLLDGPFLPHGKQLKTKQTKARFPAPDYSAIHSYLDILEKGSV